MATMATAATSLEAFLALPDQEGLRRELDEGELIEMGSPSRVHQRLVARMIVLLERAFSGQAANWETYAGIGFQLSADTARQPDVCVAKKGTLDAMRVIAGNYHVGAPELVVEVVSPTDSALDIHRKTHQYLDAGALSVWVIYTDSRHVIAHRSDCSIVEYRAGETIEEPTLMPSLSIETNSIFVDLA